MKPSQNRCYEFGPFRLDARERLLSRDGVTIPLTPKAFDLLLALIARSGRLVEKEELFQTVWPDTIVEESNLSSNIALIRKALGDGQKGLTLIETVPKRGYRFVAEVREVRPESEADLIPEQSKSHADQLPLGMSPSSSRRGRRWALSIIVLALGVLVSATVWLKAFLRPAPLPPLKITRFTSFPGNEAQLSFSPDGHSLAFSWDGEKGDNNDIYIKQVGTESRLRLTTDPAEDAWPRWSPDGRHIAFMRRTAEGFRLYRIPSLRGPESRITELPLVPFGLGQFPASWSPDGEWLAVTDRRSPQELFSIFLVSLATGDKVKLTEPSSPSNGDADPAISPDGRWVAFFRYKSGVVGDLHVIPRAGGEIR